jgi:hypothetical protein
VAQVSYLVLDGLVIGGDTDVQGRTLVGHVVPPGVVTVFLFARHLARNAAHRLHCLGSCANLSAVTDMMVRGRLQTGSLPVLRARCVMPWLLVAMAGLSL